MERGPIISVIVAIYNVREYLAECLQSIIEQKYTQLEIILVDDGSTDGSETMCDEYSKIDSRIRVIHKSNGGLSDARNTGLRVATGEYFCFVDGDDCIHPQMYELMLKQMLDNSADLVTCNYLQGNVDTLKKDITMITTSIITGTMGMQQLDIPLVVAWNKLYTRKLLSCVKYPKGKYHEDEYVIHEILYHCQKIVTINQPLYFYRRREGSIVQTMTEARVLDALDALEKRVDFVIEKSWDDVIQSVIEQLGDYCINTYFDSRNRSVLTRNNYKVLQDRVRRLCNRDLEIKSEYRLFAISPILYGLYASGKNIRQKIKRRFFRW